MLLNDTGETIRKYMVAIPDHYRNVELDKFVITMTRCVK